MTTSEVLIALADKMLWRSRIKLKAAQRIWEWSGHGYYRKISGKAQLLNAYAYQMNLDSQVVRKEAEAQR